jgi:hypothetical protein
MTSIYKVWIEGQCSEEDASSIEDTTRCGAVDKFCELEHNNSAGEAFTINEYSDVMVRDPEGSLWKIQVLPEYELSFYQSDEEQITGDQP